MASESVKFAVYPVFATSQAAAITRLANPSAGTRSATLKPSPWMVRKTPRPAPATNAVMPLFTLSTQPGIGSFNVPITVNKCHRRA
ncbi:unnamed protein product, partial [Nesidiocoris tenuis]